MERQANKLLSVFGFLEAAGAMVAVARASHVGGGDGLSAGIVLELRNLERVR